MRRVIDRMNTLSHPSHRTRITRPIKEDCVWWIRNVEAINGTTPIRQERVGTSASIDACDEGGGGQFLGEFYHLQWRDWEDTRDKHINYKEVMALAPAAHLWAPWWRGRKVYIHSDNQAAVGIINRGTAKDPYVMEVLRDVYHLSVLYDFRIRAVYYPGRYNTAADRASRLGERGGWGLLKQALAPLVKTNVFSHGPTWAAGERGGVFQIHLPLGQYNKGVYSAQEDIYEIL